MKQYQVLPKQNLFDVATYLYGSIEGVFDIMASNPDLSFDTVLQAGDVLNWNDENIIHSNIVQTFHAEHIVPANGERKVYLKESILPLLFYVNTPELYDTVKLGISGVGRLSIDWGDSSDFENIDLTTNLVIYHHKFTDTDKHIIRIYGQCSIDTLYFTQPFGVFYAVKPLVVNHIISDKDDLFLNGLYLFNNVGSIVLNRAQEQYVDSFFQYAVRHHWNRGFSMTLYTYPSGEYKEPKKDSSGQYIINTGMEALYVLTNDPEYNSQREWWVNIGNNIYCIDENKRGWYFPIYLI